MLGLVKDRWMDRDRVSREEVGGRKLRMLLCQLFLQGLAVAVPDDLQEGNGHGENHPHVDHPDVGRRWKRT